MSITSDLNTSLLLTPVINTEKESWQRKATITVTTGRFFWVGGWVCAVVVARQMGKRESVHILSIAQLLLSISVHESFHIK